MPSPTPDSTCDRKETDQENSSEILRSAVASPRTSKVVTTVPSQAGGSARIACW
jgi:hypothetical protein